MAAVAILRIRLRQWALLHLPDWIHPALRWAEFEATRLAGGLLRLLPGTSRQLGPPRRIVPTLAAYAQAHPRTAVYKEIYPPAWMRRKRPQTLDGAAHPAFAREFIRKTWSAGVGVLERGRVLTSMGAVIAADDSFLFDVSHTSASDDAGRHPIFSELRLPRVTRFDGELAVLTMYMSNVLGHYYYGHWMLDALPRLHLLERSGVPWDKLVAPQATHFHRDTLRLLGVESARIIEARDLHMEAERLVVPTLPNCVGNPPRWACEFLRSRFIPPAKPGVRAYRRLYISRERAKTRRLRNEAELFRALEQHGFERVCLEELPFLAQVQLFNEARVVVSPHSSGFTNLVFCRPGTAVLEIFNPHYVTACWYALANESDLDYGYVLGRGESRGGYRVHEDIVVEVPKVMRLLERMLEQKRAAAPAFSTAPPG